MLELKLATDPRCANIAEKNLQENIQPMWMLKKAGRNGLNLKAN